MKFLIIFLFACSWSTLTFSHPGKAASDGCHTCRTNCEKYGLNAEFRHPAKKGKNLDDCDTLLGPTDPSWAVAKLKKVVRKERRKRKLTQKQKWGDRWGDNDLDCQNTRQEILIRDGQENLKMKGHKKRVCRKVADQGNRGKKKLCIVTNGKWIDPYSGIVAKKAKSLVIDHLVPLQHAWEMGAKKWSFKKRRKFYNDRLNLFAITIRESRNKDKRGVASYLPPLDSSKCMYIKRWLKVKKKWKLDMSNLETTFLEKAKKTWCNK